MLIVTMRAFSLLVFMVFSALAQVGAEQSLSLQTEYEMLGVQSSDGVDTIKKAHRRLSLEVHPDKNPGCGARCTTRIAELNAAYDKIIYARKHLDNPELEIFFGFSDKLYNLIKSLVDFWQNIPALDKDRVWSLIEAYKTSESYEKDMAHGGTILSKWIGEILESNAHVFVVIFGVIITYNVLAVIGLVWLIWTFFRIFRFTVTVLLRLIWGLGPKLGIWVGGKKAGAGEGEAGVAQTGTLTPSSTPGRKAAAGNLNLKKSE